MTEAEAQPAPFTRLRALLVLVVTLLVGAALMVGLTWFVIGSPGRSRAIAESEGVTVTEFAVLPDDDAYPAALALDAEGTLYTGSYQSGALWAISPDGAVREIPGARDVIGAVTGLDAGLDGALYILDRVTPLEAQEAVLWRYAAGALTTLVEIPADATVGVMLPDDIAIDSERRIYISDRAPARIWRYSHEGVNLGIFWQAAPGVKTAPTGLAYDAARDALLLTDSERDAVYRIDIGSGESELLFDDAARQDYGLDGITVSPAGEIYLALLNWNRAARLDGDALTLLARDFRGASDVALDPARKRLYVSNWNQFSLGFGTRPQLPFAIDVLALPPAADA